MYKHIRNIQWIFQACLAGVLFMAPLGAAGQGEAGEGAMSGDPNDNRQMQEKIENILSQLSLEEKVALCHAQSKFSTPGVPRLGIPEIWMSDGPHGVRGEINWDNWGYAGWTNDSITAFPALTCLAATFNPELSRAYGFSLGEEARYRKKDVLLGPGVNIYRTPLNGRNFEYMGEDPFLASKMVVPYIHGVQENGVAACVKHYVLNNQEKWRDHINVEVSERALREIYLPAFKAAVHEGKVWSVMGSYNKFRGQYCSHHEYLINGILKGEWGFDGVVVTDWGSAHDTREAALFGLDMEMGTGTDGLTSTLKNAYDNYYLANPFLEKLKSGEIAEKYLDDKVRRILKLMYRTTLNPNRNHGRMNNQEHLQVARTVGTEGMVLLKNENRFFPLDPDKPLTIALIGENATRAMTVGGGSSELKAKREVSPLEGIREVFTRARIIHAKGYASGRPSYGRVNPPEEDLERLRKEAIEAAKNADVVLFIGGLNKNHLQDCEGGDRAGYKLPFRQDALLEDLLEVNPNLGVILVSGNAVAMPWVNKVKGILQAWYLGSEAGHAIAEIVSGKANPSGKLPMTFPRKLTDNAAHSYGPESYPGDSINQYYKEDILVGYRWHDTRKIRPLFAFGHGLSYTRFELSGFSIDQKSYGAGDTLQLSCMLSNNGDREGAEVVQVYIGKPGSRVPRAAKELKGFSKIKLKAGESREVRIPVRIADLKYYDEASGSWALEKGTYALHVGNASDHISKVLKFKVE